jgi:ribosomal protein S15P/S13E
MNHALESDAGAILDPKENPGAVTSVVMNLSKRIASVEKHLANHPNDRHALNNLADLKQRQVVAVKGLWQRDFSIYKEVYIQLQKIENEQENEK